MAHFEHAELGVSFDLPDNPTVLQIVQYDSRRLEMGGEPALVVLWECIKPLLSAWVCAALPDPTVNLATVQSLAAARAVEYAALRGSEWRLTLEDVPKNS